MQTNKRDHKIIGQTLQQTNKFEKNLTISKCISNYIAKFATELNFQLSEWCVGSIAR
jgi:hypothetical protein